MGEVEGGGVGGGEFGGEHAEAAVEAEAGGRVGVGRATEKNSFGSYSLCQAFCMARSRRASEKRSRRRCMRQSVTVFFFFRGLEVESGWNIGETSYLNVNIFEHEGHEGFTKEHQ